MKIESTIIKYEKPKNLDIGNVCKIENTIAMRIAYDSEAIDPDEKDLFIEDNFFESSSPHIEYDKDVWWYNYVPFVNLENGKMFFVHKDMDVIPLPNSKVIID